MSNLPYFLSSVSSLCHFLILRNCCSVCRHLISIPGENVLLKFGYKQFESVDESWSTSGTTHTHTNTHTSLFIRYELLLLALHVVCYALIFLSSLRSNECFPSKWPFTKWVWNLYGSIVFIFETFILMNQSFDNQYYDNQSFDNQYYDYDNLFLLTKMKIYNNCGCILSKRNDSRGLITPLGKYTAHDCIFLGKYLTNLRMFS